MERLDDTMLLLDGRLLGDDVDTDACLRRLIEAEDGVSNKSEKRIAIDLMMVRKK